MTLLFDMPGGIEWLFIIGVALTVGLIPRIFYLIMLQSTLESISPENRRMSPGNVWLLLIPLFGIIWHFIIVNNIADSISAEANARGTKIGDPRPGYDIGLAMCILGCFFFVPGLNILTGIAGLICWILYWVRISSYKNMILMAKNNTVPLMS